MKNHFLRLLQPKKTSDLPVNIQVDFSQDLEKKPSAQEIKALEAEVITNVKKLININTDIDLKLAQKGVDDSLSSIEEKTKYLREIFTSSENDDQKEIFSDVYSELDKRAKLKQILIKYQEYKENACIKESSLSILKNLSTSYEVSISEIAKNLLSVIGDISHNYQDYENIEKFDEQLFDCKTNLENSKNEFEPIIRGLNDQLAKIETCLSKSEGYGIENSVSSTDSNDEVNIALNSLKKLKDILTLKIQYFKTLKEYHIEVLNYINILVPKKIYNLTKFGNYLKSRVNNIKKEREEQLKEKELRKEPKEKKSEKTPDILTSESVISISSTTNPHLGKSQSNTEQNQILPEQKDKSDLETSATWYTNLQDRHRREKEIPLPEQASENNKDKKNERQTEVVDERTRQKKENHAHLHSTKQALISAKDDIAYSGILYTGNKEQRDILLSKMLPCILTAKNKVILVEQLYWVEKEAYMHRYNVLKAASTRNQDLSRLIFKTMEELIPKFGEYTSEVMHLLQNFCACRIKYFDKLSEVNVNNISLPDDDPIIKEMSQAYEKLTGHLEKYYRKTWTAISTPSVFTIEKNKNFESEFKVLNKKITDEIIGNTNLTFKRIRIIILKHVFRLLLAVDNQEQTNAVLSYFEKCKYFKQKDKDKDNQKPSQVLQLITAFAKAKCNHYTDPTSIEKIKLLQTSFVQLISHLQAFGNGGYSEVVRTNQHYINNYQNVIKRFIQSNQTTTSVNTTSVTTTQDQRLFSTPLTNNLDKDGTLKKNDVTHSSTLQKS